MDLGGADVLDFSCTVVLASSVLPLLDLGGADVLDFSCAVVLASSVLAPELAPFPTIGKASALVVFSPENTMECASPCTRMVSANDG